MADAEQPQGWVPIPKRKVPNNVWMKLAEDERVSEMINGVNGVSVGEGEDQIKIERGPESFTIAKKTYDQFRQTQTRFKKRKFVNDPDPMPLEESVESDSSVSSGGLSDGATRRLRRSHPQRKRSKGTKKRRTDWKMVGSPPIGDDEETLPIFVDRLACDLDEKNKDLLNKIVQLTGIPTADALRRKVLKLERHGGVLTKDGSRRRAPGGVFFYLVQRHPTTASAEIKRILNVKSKKPKQKIPDVFARLG